MIQVLQGETSLYQFDTPTLACFTGLDVLSESVKILYVKGGITL